MTILPSIFSSSGPANMHSWRGASCLAVLHCMRRQGCCNIRAIARCYYTLSSDTFTMYRALLCSASHLVVGVFATCLLDGLSPTSRHIVLAVTGVAIVTVVTCFLSPPVVLQYCGDLRDRIHVALSAASEGGLTRVYTNEAGPRIDDVRNVLAELDADLYQMQLAIWQRHRQILPRQIFSVPWTLAALRLLYKYCNVSQDMKLIVARHDFSLRAANILEKYIEDDKLVHVEDEFAGDIAWSHRAL